MIEKIGFIVMAVGITGATIGLLFTLIGTLMVLLDRTSKVLMGGLVGIVLSLIVLVVGFMIYGLGIILEELR